MRDRKGRFIKGHKHTKDSKKKIIKALAGRPCSFETRLKFREAMKGRKAFKNTGRTHFKKGYIPWNKGMKMSKEYCEKLSKAHKGKYKGDKHPNWRGGIANEPYSFNFIDELRGLIRKRDDRKCQLCGAPQKEFERALAVHHINYDKKDDNPNNLISLCDSCHAKTGFDRIRWIKLLTLILEDKNVKESSIAINNSCSVDGDCIIT